MTEKSYPFLDLGAVTAPYKEELIEAAARVIGSGRFIGGSEVESLERQLAEQLGVPYAIGVSNGMDALRLTLRAFVELGRLRKGQGVVVPANTFIASVLAITDASLVPVFAEPDIVTMNLSGYTLEKAIVDNPSIEIGAVMPVHLYGRVAWDWKMKEIVEERGLIVVEDTAQAIGAESMYEDGLFDSCHAGALGHAGCFSFYPTKNVGALGDAGMVVTHDAPLADMVRTLANYGSTRRYHTEYCGFNCRMDPIQAAFVAVKLRHMDEENQARRRNAEAYASAIDNPLVIHPPMPLTESERQCVWHQYVVRTIDRDGLKAYLESRGVQTDIHYPVPCHMQPAIRKAVAGLLPHGMPSLPVAEEMAKEILSLPVSSATSLSDVIEISGIINDYGKEIFHKKK